MAHPTPPPSTAPAPPKDGIIVGRIGAPFGVKGWVKIQAYTETPANIASYSPWQLYRQNRWQVVPLAETKPHGAGIIARLEGCEDRDVAATWVNTWIAVPKSALPPLPKGEYYWAELIGLTVVNQLNETLGTIAYFVETGTNDVMVVKGSKEYWLPYRWDTVIQSIDLEQQIMRVNWESDF